MNTSANTHHPSDSNDLLRLALRANATFSLFSGLLLSIAPATVGSWLGVSIDGWLRLFGIALLGHALLCGFAASRPDPTTLGRLNLLAIAPYPLLMIGLIAGGLVDRTLGQALVLADGAIVGTIAALHWRGLRAAPVPLARRVA